MHVVDHRDGERLETDNLLGWARSAYGEDVRLHPDGRVGDVHEWLVLRTASHTADAWEVLAKLTVTQ